MHVDGVESNLACEIGHVGLLPKRINHPTFRRQPVRGELQTKL